MNRRLWQLCPGLFVLALSAVCVWGTSAQAQMSEVKEKAAMYTYVSNWTIPRAQWGEMAKSAADQDKLMQKGISDGNIVGYGNDQTLIHSADGETHDDWFSSMSMAGLLKVLDQLYKQGNATAPVLSSATKHWDNLYVSHYYNWHSGSWKDLYTHEASYKLKPDAPRDAVETLSKNLIVPLMEKMMADGAVHEYEIDTQAIHTEDPSMFYVVYICSSADGLDKVTAGLQAALKANVLGLPAFDSMVDFSAHRDGLVRTTATYK
jgi:hypothetical protein